jgi:steroid delta-isomerase-like uncharacterized protein
MKPSIKRNLLLNFSILIITFLVVSGCQMKPDPSKELKPLVDKYVEVWNNGNLGDLDAIINSTYAYHSNQSPDANGLEGLKKVISSFRTSFPDVKIVLGDVIYSDNIASCKWNLTGTNTGPGEFPPTGKPVKQWGISIINFANGKISSEWVAYDNQSFMEQLGFKMMPSSEKMN